MVDQSNKPKRRRGRKGGDKDTKEAAIHQSLLLKLNDNWYNELRDTQDRNATVPAEKRPESALVQEYRAKADALFKREIQLFNQSSNQSKDDRWVESTIKSGTLRDRIAAMSVVISTDPIHKLYAMDGLLSMAGCQEDSQTNSRVAQLASEALMDLFINTYLPPNRKLLGLHCRPLTDYNDNKRTLSPKILLLWYFEELLAAKYEAFLSRYVAHTLRDGLEMDKINAIRSAAQLLASVPQGEATLLSLLVNKLGDPARKVASGAAHELRNTLNKHPAMQVVIAREVQQLAHRPQLSPRALYNCICFLNQLTLSVHNRELPVSLVRTYFGLFQVAVAQNRAKKKEKSESGSMKSRLLSALLQGVNRAHPYLPKEHQNLESHVDQLYRIVHQAPSAAATQALLLLFHVAVGMEVSGGKVKSKSEDRANRFYRALFQACGNESLLTHGKHLAMLFNLLYKALKYDSDEGRVLALSKRILSTTIHANAPVIAATVFLLSEVGKVHKCVLEGMTTVLEGSDSLTVLDPKKREPRGALVVFEQDGSGKDSTTRAPVWELSLLSHHVHPSVQKFSRAVNHIEYSGDPLRDFSLAHFLDKFSYRNPKKAPDESKASGSIAAKRRSHQTSLPVNDASFLAQSQVDEPDQFFRIFFAEQARRDKMKGVVSAGENDADGQKAPIARKKPIPSTIDFSELEETWESDDEEEAFVDSLAEKIIEDSVHENGPADLDDEDPDMEGWGDMHSDAGDDSDDEIVGYDEDHVVNNSEYQSGNEESSEGNEKDADAFMDNMDDDSSDGHSAQSGSDGVHDKDSMGSGTSNSDPLAWAVEEDEESLSNSKKRSPESDVFADAEKYQSMIENSWTELVEQQLHGEGATSKKKPRREAR